jgi:hypothetical protein
LVIYKRIVRVRIILTDLLVVVVVAILSATVIQQSAFAQNPNVVYDVDGTPVTTINGTISADYTIEDVDNRMLKDDAKSAKDSALRLITKTIERHEGKNNTNSTNITFTNGLSNLTWNMVGVNGLLSLAKVQFDEMEDKIKGNMTQYRFSITIESACKSVDQKFSRGCTFTVRLD